MTAYHYRTIAAKMVLAGIPDPMALPSLHALLNVTEHIMLEACEKPRDRDHQLHLLYRPDPADVRRINGKTQLAVPSGFSKEEQASSFDAFAAAAR